MAIGSAIVTLVPSLVGATLWLRYRSYEYDEPIIWTVTTDQPTIFDGANYTGFDLYQVQFPAQEIGGISYNEVRTPSFQFSTDHEYDLLLIQSGLPLGEVTEINLPDELALGDPITGYARVKNVGSGSGILRCTLTTEWDGATYSAEQVLDPLQTLEATLPAGVVMPNQDAVITIRAEHLDSGVWIIDDVKTH